MFPSNYTGRFSSSSHSIDGVVWNSERFKLVSDLGSIKGRAYAVKLLDKTTKKTIVVASGHFSGCNPYCEVTDPKTGLSDALKGDSELEAVIKKLNSEGGDLLLIGMDSNVTSLHPRMQILKDAGYKLDYDNFLESTCTNPYVVLDTRIDWIAVKALGTISTTVTNIPVQSVGLNNIQSNFSDHKPIAAKVIYDN
jgi:hypothetical protein